VTLAIAIGGAAMYFFLRYSEDKIKNMEKLIDLSECFDRVV